jgi:hypothetical protein
LQNELGKVVSILQFRNRGFRRINIRIPDDSIVFEKICTIDGHAYKYQFAGDIYEKLTYLCFMRKTPEEIFNELKELPNRQKVPGRDLIWFYKYQNKGYTSGVDMAFIVSPISIFYQQFLLQQKKTTTLIPRPANISTDVYEKLFSVYQKASECNIGDHMKIMIQQYVKITMSMCMYEDFFPTEMRTYKGKTPIQIARELPDVGDDCESLGRFYNQYTSNLSDIRHILFMFDSADVVVVIEFFNQNSKK